MEPLADFHKVKTASLVSGLLIDPKYHSNNLRIEILLSHILSDCSGIRVPTSANLKSWLNDFPLVTGINHLEDPVEDTFVSRVATKNGDFRIYGGIWEGYVFYLQRVLNVVETIPSSIGIESLTGSISALLKLSEEIAERNRVRLNVVAESHDKETICPPNTENLKRRAETLFFLKSDLKRLGVTFDNLKPFIIDPANLKGVKDQKFGLSDLLSYPLLYYDEKIFVVLPTAITWALRFFVFRWLQKKKLIQKFYEQLVLEYVSFLRDQPVIGKFIPPQNPVMPDKIQEAFFLEFAGEIDLNRYVQLILKVDTLNGLFDDGINVPSKKSKEQSIELTNRVQKAKTYFGGQPGFREGLSLVVLAGYGKFNSAAINRPSDNWNLGILTATDLETMLWTPGTTSKTIWRFIKHQKYVETLGVKFINPNGILNLYGWWQQSDHMMVPSSVQILPGKQQILMIPTDCIAKVRRRAWMAVDHRTALFIDGTRKQIRKKNLSSYFDDAEGSNLYVSYTDYRHKRLFGCALTSSRSWWLSVLQTRQGLDAHSQFRTWDSFHNWLQKISLKLDTRFPNAKAGPLLFQLDTSDIKDYGRRTDYPEAATIGEIVEYTVDGLDNIITLKLKQGFSFFLNNPKNISEKAVVKAFIQGFIEWAGIDCNDSDINHILDSVVLNDGSRYIHAFVAKNFREMIGDIETSTFEEIDNSDANILRIGLGHFNSPGEKRILGKDNCTEYLNALVDQICNLLIEDLRKFNRQSVVEKFLLNIEGIASDRERWHRTMKAVFDLRKNKESVFSGKELHFAKLHAADIASRTLIEIAGCECPIKEGLQLSGFELSPLMAKASMIFQIGNISDGIDKGVISPDILVTPNGDVKTDQAFREAIFNKVVSQNERDETTEAVESYEKNFESHRDNETKDTTLTTDYLSAFNSEFRVSFEELRLFLEMIEDMGIEKNKKVFKATRSQLISFREIRNLFSEKTLLQILDSFSLSPRDKWSVPPDGFAGRDIYPWLFRRRLSLLSKPIVRIDDSVDPTFIINPGFCVDAIVYIVDCYRGCNIEEDRCFSMEMKKWVGDERARKGKLFVTKAAKVISDLGYQVRTEIEVSTIIPKKLLVKDFGDFDIIAWKIEDGKIHLIECKELLFAKTFKEVAEQLQEFKGLTRNGKDDRLKKHLDRINVARSNLSHIASFCGKSGSVEIVPSVLFSKQVPVLFVEPRTDINFRHLEGIRESGVI